MFDNIDCPMCGGRISVWHRDNSTTKTRKYILKCNKCKACWE